MAEVKTYKTPFAWIPTDGEVDEFRIPFDINGNEKPDELVIRRREASIYIDGEYAGEVTVKSPLDDPGDQIDQVDIGDFDGHPGLEARFYSTAFQSPLVMTKDDFLAKWRAQKQYRADLLHFQGLQKMVAKPYSALVVAEVVKWIDRYEKGVFSQSSG